MKLATIPFQGFYNSIHDAEFDRAVESEIDYFYEETGCDMPESLVDLFHDGMSEAFSAASEEYAKEYAESFLEWLGLDGEFESMTSPKFYNFETDRIFVKLTRESILRMWDSVPSDVFTKLVKARFTSRDGFISHYSNDWRDWGEILKWDHNQLGTLVLAFAEYEQGDDWDSMSEYGLVEDYFCNGGIDNALCENSPKWTRAANIAYYLRERSRREIKTLKQWYAANQKPFSTTPLGSVL